MTPADAAKLIELPPDATPEQIEARFNELRSKLEDKIAKAPTPGLKSKYRESLDEITTAFEALTLAADSSALPVLQKQSGESKAVSAGAASVRAGSTGSAATPPREPTRKKSGGMEFVIVVVIAVAVLGAGGWWVLKTRSEGIEKVRLELEAKAEAERRATAERAEQADAARVAAETSRQEQEAKRQADAAEQARLASEEKARQDKQARQTAALRAGLAELKIAWEATEQRARNAERRAAELRSDLRNANASTSDGRRLQAEFAARQEFADWLNRLLPRHPARVARAQAEELLAARQFDEANAALQQAAEAQRQLDEQIPATEKTFLTLTTSVQVDVAETVTWELIDAYGDKVSGKGPRQVAERPFGAIRLEAHLPGFKSKEARTVLRRDEAAKLTVEYGIPRATIFTWPEGAAVSVNGKPSEHKTPCEGILVAPGLARFDLTLPGHRPLHFEWNFEEGQVKEWAHILYNDDSGVAGFAFERRDDSRVFVTKIIEKSPAVAAGLMAGSEIVAIMKGMNAVEARSTSNPELIKFLAGDPGTVLALRVREPGAQDAREVRLARISLKELEERNRPIAEVHLLRVPHGTMLRVPVILDGKKYMLRNREQVVLRRPPGRVEITATYLNSPTRHVIEVAAGINYFDCDTSDLVLKFVPLSASEGAALDRTYRVVEAVPVSGK
jgi:chemotaxis protein histidine kinase CheA